MHVYNTHSLIRRRRTGVTLLWLLCLSTPAFAHKLNMFTYAEGKEVHVEGYFADGTKAKNSTITVWNDARETVVEGVTDEAGKFTFTITEPTNLRIVLNAGMGHQTEHSMLANELGDTSTASSVAQAEKSSSTLAPQTVVTAAATPQPTPLPTDLSPVIEKAVANALLPLAREIAELKDRTKLSDMIGGIGFIIGIMGLFAFSKTRNRATHTSNK